MNQSKKILAALVAVPASVVVADGAMAAENEATITKAFEIKNDFIGSSTYTTQASSKTFTLNSKVDLEAQILAEMAGFTKGFTITYSGVDVADYEATIKGTLNSIKENLNKSKSVIPASADTATFDTTELYGMFNNMRVKATETVTNSVITSVKLEFSVNYLGTADDLQRAKDNHTVTAPSNDVIQKVKAVHDYIIKNTHYSAKNHNIGSLLSSGGSSHTYALWTYVLLKKLDPNFEVEYVYGIANGEYHSWNIIKIGDKWYDLDVATNDSTVKGIQTINYRNFLTYTENERRIISKSSTVSKDSTYNYFKTIDNLAQSKDAIYYANAQSNGEIFKLNLSDLKSEKIDDKLSDASTGTGRMVYYEQTSGDTATVVGEYLYFINDSNGKYLYRYNLDGNEAPTLLVKDQIESISLSGSTLTYNIKGGGQDSLPLNKLADLNKEIAQKVINAIITIETMDPASSTFKEAVKNARILYMALTEEQKTVVGAVYLSKLQDFENQIGSDVKSKDIIEKINALDELDLGFVAKVKEVEAAYNAYSNKAAIYNASILTSAIAKIKKAEGLSNELNKRIEDITDKEDKDLFNQYEDFIPFIENLLREYDSLLPSIRAVFINTAEFDNYRIMAVQLRREAQNFINEVKIIDENSEDFFKEMDALVSRQNNFVLSQNYLIRSEAAIVTDKINLYNTLKQGVTAFKQGMSAITTGNVDTIKLTPELIAQMQAAIQQFEKMKPAQKKELEVEKILLDKIIKRINDLTTNTKLTDLENMLVTLTIDSISILDGITTALATADAAIVEIVKDATIGIANTEEVLSLLSAKANESYQLFARLSNLVEKAKELKIQLGGLTNTSTAEKISELRTKYDALEPLLKKFFTVEEQLLITQETRLQDEANKVIVDTLIADIDNLNEDSKLAEIIEVKNRYDTLASTLQGLVINKQKLLDLWEKVSADADAYQKAIYVVNKAIEELSDKSSREDIQKVIDAYELLSVDQQAQIFNYEKIEELLSQLEGKEQEELDQIAAEKVKELILSLTNESTKTELDAARAAYEALSTEAKALITKQVLDVLKYYESRLTELSEQAKKEAAVVQDRIDRITSSYTEAQVKNIRIAYNALSQLAKEYVTNLQKLIDAENKIIYDNTVVKQAKLDANAFDVYMNDITRNSTQAEIAKARAYYNNLSTEAKKHVTTYEKLVRLETMWKDPKYIDLVYTYYPDYIHDIKPGGIVIEKPKYDSIYIPDDSETDSSSSSYTPSTDWTTYETMKYQNGRYTASITTTQAQSIKDRSKILKADDIEIVIPSADLYAATATVGVTVNVTNNQLNIQFKQGKQAKTFSEYVEIHVPFNILNGNASQIIERVAESSSSASFKIEGSSFIIRTKTSGTFKATAAPAYSDLPNNAQGTAMRELAKRGILFEAKPRLSQSYKQVTKFEAASMMATALGLSSASQSSYQDVKNERDLQQVQGLLEAGIMSGFTSSYFNGEGAVTKQEAAIMIANMYRYLNRDVSRAYSGFPSSFKDIMYLSLEARQSIAILELFGVVNAADSFGPTKELTRGEFAELFYNALKAIDYL